MKKYKVWISRLQYGQVVVEAKSEEEAKAKAEELAKKNNRKVSWHDAEITDAQPEEVVFE